MVSFPHRRSPRLTRGIETSLIKTNNVNKRDKKVATYGDKSARRKVWVGLERSRVTQTNLYQTLNTYSPRANPNLEHLPADAPNMGLQLLIRELSSKLGTIAGWIFFWSVILCVMFFIRNKVWNIVWLVNVLNFSINHNWQLSLLGELDRLFWDLRSKGNIYFWV